MCRPRHTSIVFNHAEPGYSCPFCRNIRYGKSARPLEILHRYEQVFVKLNPKWWPRNPGGALVIPIEHYENLYDLPVELGTPLQAAIRDTALAMKSAYDCDGVSTRQHNEPAGNQDVWHYHVHVFPRFADDGLYGSRGEWASAADIEERARQLRSAWPTG